MDSKDRKEVWIFAIAVWGAVNIVRAYRFPMS